MKWTEGTPWPFPDPQPTFSACPSMMNGQHVRWVVDSDGLVSVFGYPRGIPIPDYYGELADGRHLLYEAKSKGNVNRARTQLETGDDWMRRNGNSVDLLGIMVVKLDGKQPWRRGTDGLLQMRGRLGPVPVRVNGKPVMVQEARDR